MRRRKRMRKEILGERRRSGVMAREPRRIQIAQSPVKWVM